MAPREVRGGRRGTARATSRSRAATPRGLSLDIDPTALPGVSPFATSTKQNGRAASRAVDVADAAAIDGILKPQEVTFDMVGIATARPNRDCVLFQSAAWTAKAGNDERAAPLGIPVTGSVADKEPAQCQCTVE